MKFYIFKVKPSVGRQYYVVNNCYLGYLGFDSDPVRSILEYNAKVTLIYQLYASGTIKTGLAAYDLFHNLFCTNARLSIQEARRLQYNHNLTLSKNKKWYKIVFPNPNSSEQELREVKFVGKFEE
jgi:hypothetical protein